MQSDSFKRCMFFDLPDYRTSLRGFPLPTYSVPANWWRTLTNSDIPRYGNLARSSCSHIPAGATPSSRGWNAHLFNEIGLGSIVQNGFKQLGGDLVHGEGLVMTAGLPIGTNKRLTTLDCSRDPGG